MNAIICDVCEKRLEVGAAAIIEVIADMPVEMLDESIFPDKLATLVGTMNKVNFPLMSSLSRKHFHVCSVACLAHIHERVAEARA